jgi:hypothetical protein
MGSYFARILGLGGRRVKAFDGLRAGLTRHRYARARRANLGHAYGSVALVLLFLLGDQGKYGDFRGAAEAERQIYGADASIHV